MGIYLLESHDGRLLQIVTSRKTSLIEALAHALRHCQHVRAFSGHSNGKCVDVTKIGRNTFAVSMDGDVATNIKIQHCGTLNMCMNRTYID